jgi:transposase InsO family protein/transposase-like protein
MHYNQSEKMEIIRIIEGSQIGVVRTLRELAIHPSVFYKWYNSYKEKGYDGLARKKRRQFWNQIPPWEKDRVVEIALDKPELSPRELACHITDKQHYFISESSVYRILKSRGLITSPAYIVMKAADKFKQPTQRTNEMWQTDFTYFKIIGWGWYYLSTILDDYSRFIVAWKLCKTMKANDVEKTLQMALKSAGLSKDQRPKLLSDNGSCYISNELKSYLDDMGIKHVRGAPNHPQTQGKIERYHRSLKNVIKLENYYLPGELKLRLSEFVDYYNNYRYHESLKNLTPADVYYGRAEKILKQRKKIKQKTMLKRKFFYENHLSL